MMASLNLYVAYLLGAAALVSALLLIRKPMDGNPRQTLLYVTVSGLCSWLVALIAPVPVSPAYKGAILFVLTLALIAAVTREISQMPNYFSSALRMIGLSVLLVAFLALLSLREISFWILLPIVTVALAFLALQSSLRETWGATVAYAVLAGLAATFSFEFGLQVGWLSGVAALAAMLFLLGADLLRGHILIRDQFLQFAPTARLLSMMGYLFLAASVWTLP